MCSVQQNKTKTPNRCNCSIKMECKNVLQMINVWQNDKSNVTINKEEINVTLNSSCITKIIRDHRNQSYRCLNQLVCWWNGCDRYWVCFVRVNWFWLSAQMAVDIRAAHVFVVPTHNSANGNIQKHVFFTSTFFTTKSIQLITNLRDNVTSGRSYLIQVSILALSGFFACFPRTARCAMMCVSSPRSGPVSMINTPRCYEALNQHTEYYYHGINVNQETTPARWWIWICFHAQNL